MKCYDCGGKGGWGHTSSETDLYGRTMLREAHERFFSCPTCKGMGNVTEAVYNQSKMAEDERWNNLDRERGEEADQWARYDDIQRAMDYLNRYR
jgi:hypothetical protein